MNKRWVVASSILALALGHASAQTSGGTSSGGTSGGGTTSSGSGSSSSSSSSGQNSGNANQQPGVQNPQLLPPGSQNQLPPGLQNRQQLPPGLQNRQQLPPGLAMRTNNVGTITNQTSTFTNRGNFTNGFAGNTNQFGNTNLSATGGTNRVFSTNHFDVRHFDRNQFRDEAITPADQSLLIQIKQTIITQISVGGSGVSHWIPIHCGCHSGRVRLMGLVANQDQLQQILGMVSQMPGVSGVENALSTLPPDQALTENDRVILAQIRQVIPQAQPPAPWTPVSFDVRQGAVGIIGIVPTANQSQQIETTVRQVPGVVQTSNTLVVDMSRATVAPAETSLPR